MNTPIWIFQGLLSAFFLMPAYTKLKSSKEKLVEKKMLKPEQSMNAPRFIGLMELLGSIGIIIPQLTGVAKILTPIAAIGFALIMLGAFLMHLKKKEYKIFRF
jgi:uncharacterized membrane protein YphA (DoxX/SURF4 family)